MEMEKTYWTFMVTSHCFLMVLELDRCGRSMVFPSVFLVGFTKIELYDEESVLLVMYLRVFRVY